MYKSSPLSGLIHAISIATCNYLCCVRISSFAVDDSVGWLVQVSLTFFAFTGSARLVEGVNANSVRLTCTSQPTESSTAKLEIRTQRKSAVTRLY